MDADIDLLVDTIAVVLIDAGQYTVNSNTHQFLSDIPSGARIGTFSGFTTKTTTNGTFDADDVVVNAGSATSVEAYAIYKDTGSAATSPLIAYFDTENGLPFTPASGGNVTIKWNASGIFTILTNVP